MNPQKPFRSERHEGARESKLAADRCATSDQEYDPAHQHHGAQSCDERVHAEERDNKAVHQADRAAGHDPRDHARRNAGLQHHHAGNAAGECGRRTDREIEAPADDHECHPHGDHRHDRGLHQDVGEVERR